MHEIIRKYAIDQEENKIFLKEIRENLLAFAGGKLLLSGGRRNTVEGSQEGDVDHLPHGACVQYRDISGTCGERRAGGCGA